MQFYAIICIALKCIRIRQICNHVINIQLHRFAYPGHDSIPLEVLGRHGLTKVRPKRKWE